MKKFVMAIVAVAMLTGIACGGSSWSDEDKAQLKVSTDLAVKMDILTRDQADCMSDWLQDNYDSMEAAEAGSDDVNAQKDLADTCKIDPSLIG